MSPQQTLAKCFPRVEFGTSGVRALVTDLNAQAVSAFVFAFIDQMRKCHGLSANGYVNVGMDLRPSSPVISAAVCQALKRLQCTPKFLGVIPTPALALQGMTAGIPGVMITGSHIPFDRNGIKFFSPVGEILKEDERAIISTPVPDDWLTDSTSAIDLPEVDSSAIKSYFSRYVDYFGRQSLAGQRVGLYEHSAAGRDITRSVLIQLGAEVISLGRSDKFVPIDTEAVEEADLSQARAWCAEYQLDAIVSTDGDGDRPLVFAENGEFVPGDLLGVLCARDLGIKQLVIPVSCNTSVEQCGAFKGVLRTRIGSPFVIAGMNELIRQGNESVAGFEANGGFLLGMSASDLAPLPTRDALLPMISLLASAVKGKSSVSSLVAALPGRFTCSDRIKDFPSDEARIFLENLATVASLQCKVSGKSIPPINVDTTDGVRLTFVDGDIVHLRASGNAPELRCYSESASIQQAKNLCKGALGRLA